MEWEKPSTNIVRDMAVAYIRNGGRKAGRFELSRKVLLMWRKESQQPHIKVNDVNITCIAKLLDNLTRPMESPIVKDRRTKLFILRDNIDLSIEIGSAHYDELAKQASKLEYMGIEYLG